MIESGMALFAIQLVRVVLSILPVQSLPNTVDFVIGINQRLNGIAPTIISVRELSFEESFMEVEESL